jgi:D-xylose transport system permease protein
MTLRTQRTLKVELNPPGVSVQFLAMPLILVGIWGLFALLNPQFLGPRNLSMLMIELSVTATLAVGMLLVILPGHIDLSAGSGVGLLGGLAAVLVFHFNWPAPAAMLVSLLAGVAIWSGMGLAIVKLRIQAFIITLGGLLAFKGLFWLVIQSSTVPVVGTEGRNLYSLLTTGYVPPAWGLVAMLPIAAVIFLAPLVGRHVRWTTNRPGESSETEFLRGFVMFQSVLLAVLICNRYRGVPMSLVILCGLSLLIHVLIRHTAFGRYLIAIGNNQAAAYVCGIPVERTVTVAFLIMGAIVAVTGFMQTAYAGASTTTVGELMELDAIAACVIGGASLKGGRGTVLGTLLGALIMASLLNGMTLMAVAPEIKLIVRGTVLVLAVLMDVKLKSH